jgi:Phage tail sheath protein subtilisin-like domain/Phage tail sheath C-terminal domain
MAEILISPGIFTSENDQSQITQGPITAGAAIIGPTVFGPVNIPTVVTSYSQYKSIFGSSFISGGAAFEYLTSMAVNGYFQQGGTSLLVTRVASGSYTPATASIAASGSITAFTLETLSSGVIMNNAGGTITNGALPSGSSANIRWEIVSSNSGSGLFSLVIRRGDDYENVKTVVETWNNLSLDPNQSNYIAYVIGDQTQNAIADPTTGNYYLQSTGSYKNNSSYVRVKSVNLMTPNYFNSNGTPQNQYTSSLPLVGSGSLNGAFGGATGALYGSFGIEAINMYEAIPTVASVNGNSGTNTQGLHATDYDIAINLLQNTDAYQFNSIYAPGITAQNAASEINALLTLAQNRGDNIAVVDMVGYGQNIGIVTSQAQSFDNSYGATYWPWIQIKSVETGKINFVPASTMVPAVYEYNDKIGAEWFAPAGFTRGGMSTVLQPERKLSVSDRNTLYAAKVNAIATFPGVGTVIYGQKTLQAKASALDRVNVRRLLISLKSYIGQIAQGLVFEPNTQVTRNKFLNAVNPYLASVQQRQGLYSFSVIMDTTNNTPDVIDRNELIGSIYLQPTRTAEFIYLTFNILPTGLTFG